MNRPPRGAGPGPVLPDATRADAREVSSAERIRRAVQTMEDGPVPVTASLGVATFPTDGTDALSLLASADAALYAAKEAGRNRVVDAEVARRRPLSAVEDRIPMRRVQG